MRDLGLVAVLLIICGVAPASAGLWPRTDRPVAVWVGSAAALNPIGFANAAGANLLAANGSILILYDATEDTQFMRRLYGAGARLVVNGYGVGGCLTEPGSGPGAAPLRARET